MPEGTDRPEPAEGMPAKPQAGAEQAEEIDKSFGELLKELFEDINHLIRQEIALFKAEMNEKMMTIAGGAGLMAGAAFLAVFAFGAITAAIILAVDLWWPAWASALVVAAGYLVIATLLILIGRSRFKKLGKAVPEQTVETLKEDVAWAKERTQSAKTSS